MRRQDLKTMQFIMGKLEMGETLTPDELATVRAILARDRDISDARVKRWSDLLDEKRYRISSND